ncbi:hypothetical protein KR222_003243 [Zaprionus bogoriensis]|nr:hypothetical protein KR222_003243 [Zaprionus bogoriensis]
MLKQKPKGSGKPGPGQRAGSKRPGAKPGAGPRAPHKAGKQHKQKRSKEHALSKLAATDAEIQELKSKYEAIDESSIKTFAQFPLSKKTLKALAESKFTTPTPVQLQSIGPALRGRDVLGAAITGSGKTLAFLIPVLEHLYVNKWSRSDGVGAIIISPTRELAYQIFETLKKVGKHHDFSAGLIIGGKNLKFERTRMDQCNILICTPGRLLQHMDENPLFNTSTMEVLVLDEADRCLDMGFQRTLNSIIENFPPQRQTLLFSATQTNTLEDLARLDLQDPVYVGYGTAAGPTAAAAAESSTSSSSSATAASAVLAVPELLQQSYVVLPLEEKITMLWSFIKNHLKQKIIVFVSSCKQAKYLYEIFCKLRPGVGLLALYGTLHQDRRIAIYEDFLRKSHVVMFATDVASRGLDFPAVNWVLQLDCPEDVSQYIHRAGRSARNKSRGECLLVLTPSEEEHMIAALRDQLKVDIRCVHIDPKKLFSPRIKIEAFLAQFPELRASAQRAFLAYLKSVFLMRNKRLFNVLSLDLDAFAQSLGLAVTPRVPFLEKLKWRQKQQQQQETQKSSNFAASDAEQDEDEQEDDDFIKIKRRDHDVEGGAVDLQELNAVRRQQQHQQEDGEEEEDKEELVVPKREAKLVTKAALAKKALKKNLQVNSKLKFDEDGQTLGDERNQMRALALAAKKQQLLQQQDDDGGINLMLSKALLNEEDQYDKQRFRELVKKRHKLQREKLRKKAEQQQSESEDEDEDAEQEQEQAAQYESESEASVDLSWLPDPDKVYGKKANRAEVQSEQQQEDESDDDEDEDEDEDSAEPVHKKSRITDKLTLHDAEAIVANLLAS